MKALFVSTVVCRRCHAEFDARADSCTQCGHPARSPAPTPETTPRTKSRILDQPWLILVVMLHLGFLGAPLYLMTHYSLGIRLLICLASVAYTFIALAGIYWGLMQIARVFTV